VMWCWFEWWREQYEKDGRGVVGYVIREGHS
jgi:hypothetical protein